jgi:hypothetical protein
MNHVNTLYSIIDLSDFEKWHAVSRNECRIDLPFH